MWPDWGLTPAQWDQFGSLRTACLVGPDTMKRFHLHIGQQIMLKGTLYPFNVTLNIVGVLGAKSPPSLLYFPPRLSGRSRGPAWHGGQHSGCGPTTPPTVPQVIAALDEQFANSSARDAKRIGSVVPRRLHEELSDDLQPGRDLRRDRRDHDRVGGGEYRRDVDPRAARRNRGDALDGIHRGHDPFVAAGRVGDNRLDRRTGSDAVPRIVLLRSFAGRQRRDGSVRQRSGCRPRSWSRRLVAAAADRIGERAGCRREPPRGAISWTR